MRLAHLHIPDPIPYLRSLQLQEALLERHFAYNTSILKSSKTPNSPNVKHVTQPRPTLLTFQTDPVYTVGRRHLKSSPLSQSQIEFLTTNGISPGASKGNEELATFFPSPRGGLLTYHAPGQLTAYLIISLRAHGITPRCFIRLLENTVVRTCSRHGVANTLTTEDPGVWIGEKSLESQQSDMGAVSACGGDATLKPTTRKICAIGVHVTRGITSHGIGLNIRDAAIVPSPISHLYALPSKEDTDPKAAPGYLSWGFSRIIACGLEGKSVTWLTREGAKPETTTDLAARSLAEEVCNSLTQQGRINVNGIEQVSEKDILAGVESANEGKVE